MSTVDVAPDQKLVLYGEPWETYVRLLRMFDERRHLRITYDRGALEIMTLSAEHEVWKHLIARLIVTLTEELNLPIAGYGSLTMKRRRKLRGLEPDECFWIANEPLVRNLTKFSPLRDPPPDLVVEVEVSRSALNRLGIYATLKVPEVWRFDGRRMEFLGLGDDGEYSAQRRSRSFPLIAPDEIDRFLALRGTIDQNALVRQFREWIRERSKSA
jgi:Uma2 family endonuclease